MNEYPVAREFIWQAFSSTSADGSISADFAGSGTLFTITCTSGKDVSSFSAEPSEAELLLPMGTKLRVMNAVELAGTHVITLEEVAMTEVELSAEQAQQVSCSCNVGGAER
jgi:hypothetical protein